MDGTEGGGTGWILLFPEVTLFENNGSIILPLTLAECV